MVYVHKFEDGKRAILDPSKDWELYGAPHNPPNTGSRYTSGTDLQVHETKSHGPVFYLYEWSMWQGTEPSIRVITKEEAEEFLENKVGDYNDFPDKSDIERMNKFGINIIQETA